MPHDVVLEGVRSYCPIEPDLASAERHIGAVPFAATVRPSSADAPRGVADSNVVRVSLGRGEDDVLSPAQQCCENGSRFPHA